VTGEIKHDKNMVDWTVIVWENDDGVFIKAQEGGMHSCTKSEIDRFYSPS
jgi:hypothetical protein